MTEELFFKVEKLHREIDSMRVVVHSLENDERFAVCSYYECGDYWGDLFIIDDELKGIILKRCKKRLEELEKEFEAL